MSFCRLYCVYWCDVPWVPTSLHACHSIYAVISLLSVVWGCLLLQKAALLANHPQPRPGVRSGPGTRLDQMGIYPCCYCTCQSVLKILFSSFTTRNSTLCILRPRKLEINWLQCVTCNNLLLLPPFSSWLSGGRLQLYWRFSLRVELWRMFPFLSCNSSMKCLPEFYF